MQRASQTKDPRSITAEWMWNWPATFVVNDGWQDFRSETLLIDTTQVFKDKIHLVMSEHLIVQTEENLDYTLTETMKEHRSLAFASNNDNSEEPSVQKKSPLDYRKYSKGNYSKWQCSTPVLFSLKEETNVLN